MIFFLLFFLFVSLVSNFILIWYCRKLVKNLWFGINNVESLQALLNEYADSMQSLYELEQFYGDETIKTAVKNTKMVVEACRVYKETIIDKQEQKIDNQQKE